MPLSMILILEFLTGHNVIQGILYQASICLLRHLSFLLIRQWFFSIHLNHALNISAKANAEKTIYISVLARHNLCVKTAKSIHTTNECITSDIIVFLALYGFFFFWIKYLGSRHKNNTIHVIKINLIQSSVMISNPPNSYFILIDFLHSIPYRFIKMGILAKSVYKMAKSVVLAP